MGKVVIAPVGENINALFQGIKEFPTERIILVTPEDKIDIAEDAKKQLEKFKIQVMIRTIKSEGESALWEEMFETVSKIRKNEPDSEILVNVTTGDRTTNCAATSAAFVNGLKAFSVGQKGVMLLPVLKFSYYKLLTDKKMEILKVLNQPGCCLSLEELSRRTKMSLPLTSYHVNGTLKSEGLKDLGLVETKENNGRTEIHLSMLGRLLVKGYVEQPEE
ncbi:MAG: DUF6293 family protein [Candidatus Nanoarchaeia archaeon]